MLKTIKSNNLQKTANYSSSICVILWLNWIIQVQKNGGNTRKSSFTHSGPGYR